MSITRVKALNVLISILLLTLSCKHDLERPSWDVDVVVPLVTSTLDIGDMVNDTMYKVNVDSSIIIVYKNTLNNLSLDSLILIPDNTFGKTVTLDSLRLSSKQIVHPVSLGEVAQNAGIVGQIIIAAHGDSAVIPPLTGLTANDVDVDANEFFKTATLNQGFMDVTIENQWPIDISNLIYLFKNKSSGVTIAIDTFLYIPAGDIQTQVISLAGKTVEGDLLAQIINMDSPGSGGNKVYVDTNDALVLTMNVYDLKPYAATAMFPAQEVVNSKDIVKYDLDDIELKSFTIQSGRVKVECISTLQDTLYFTYTIPSATLSGNMFIVDEKVLPAPPGDTSYFLNYYDFTGYTMDLTGPNKDTVNTFTTLLTGRIDSTGKIVSLSLADSIYVYVGVENLIPEYAIGYLGKDTLSIGPETSEFTLTDKIIQGQIDFEKVDFTLEIKNGIGINADVDIINLTSANSLNNSSVTLRGTVLDNTFKINRATDPPLTSSYNTLAINSTNSNIENLIEIFPDKLSYSLNIFINPSGNISNYNDFVYRQSNLETNFNMEIPLSAIANVLVLQDTVDFLSQNLKNTDKIISGIIVLYAKNGYPIDTRIQMYILNDNGNIIDSLFSQNNILAASVDNNFKAVAPTTSILKIPVDQKKISLLQSTSKLLLNILFDSQPKSNYMRIYSDYVMNIRVVGEFNYLVEKKK